MCVSNNEKRHQFDYFFYCANGKVGSKYICLSWKTRQPYIHWELRLKLLHSIIYNFTLVLLSENDDDV